MVRIKPEMGRVSIQPVRQVQTGYLLASTACMLIPDADHANDSSSLYAITLDVLYLVFLPLSSDDEIVRPKGHYLLHSPLPKRHRRNYSTSQALIKLY